MLHRLWPWPRRTYPDARLAWLARLSVADDPLLADLTRVRITCTRGVIHLTGRVPQSNDTARIEANIRGALANAGLPYAGLRNALQASVMETQPARSDRAATLTPLLAAP